MCEYDVRHSITFILQRLPYLNDPFILTIQMTIINCVYTKINLGKLH
jgi:hypothetical protein